MKKIIAMLIAAIQILAAGSALAQGPAVTVRLDGVELELPVGAFIEDNRTMVPLRGVFEAVGAEVAWDQDTKSIFISKIEGDTMRTISMQIGYTDVFVNTDKTTLDVAPRIVNNYTYVPLRFVIDALGETVEWDQDTYTVDILTK